MSDFDELPEVKTIDDLQEFADDQQEEFGLGEDDLITSPKSQWEEAEETPVGVFFLELNFEEDDEFEGMEEYENEEVDGPSVRADMNRLWFDEEGNRLAVPDWKKQNTEKLYKRIDEKIRNIIEEREGDGISNEEREMARKEAMEELLEEDGLEHPEFYEEDMKEAEMFSL